MSAAIKLTFWGVLILLTGCASNKQTEAGETNPKAESATMEQMTGTINYREPHLKLQAENKVASGFSGCNTFTGSFEMYGNALTFTPLAATQRACIEGMDIEPAYLSRLQSVTRFKIEGDSLTLFADDHVALKFEAVYF